MRCPQCQTESPPDAAFCPECGARVEIACPACGTTIDASHKFCIAVNL